MSEKYAGKYLWHWHLLVRPPSDVERSIQCQGGESLSMELIISITHGHAALSCLSARQDARQEHYQFSSGRKCRGRARSEARTPNGERDGCGKSRRKRSGNATESERTAGGPERVGTAAVRARWLLPARVSFNHGREN